MKKTKIHLPFEGSFAEAKPRPRVGLAIPSGDQVHADFAMCLAALTCAPKQPVAIINTKGSLVADSRNRLVAEARRLRCEWIFFIDSDMVFPRDALDRLLAHDKDIVGATYCKRVPPYEVLGLTLDGERLEAASGVVEMAGVPTGCLLVRMSVFDHLIEPYFRTPAVEAREGVPGHIQGEDYYFCAAARDAGFSVWLDVDLTMQLGHIGQHILSIPTYEDTLSAQDGQIELPS